MAETQQTRSDAEVITSYTAALDDHDIDGLLATLSDDIELTWVPVGTFHGKAEVRSALEELFTAFPDFSRPESQRIVSDDRAALEYQASGTFEGGPFAGLEPTGNKGTIDVCEFMELANGRIVRSTVYWDGMQMARELGVMPAEGSPGDKAMTALINLTSKAKKRLQQR
ncbi:MAG: ester cyclase [Nitriliruptorales bacterium]|nr:ester cyclase [Nitriliruptorales bacterium]